MWTNFLDWFDRNKLGIVGSLMLHTVVLFVLAFQNLQIKKDEDTPGELLIEVATPPIEPTPEELQEQQRALNAQEVKSLSSNVSAEQSQQRLSARAQERISESVEEDLREMEREEFERLQAERTSRGEDIHLPALDPSKWDPKKYKPTEDPKPTKVEGVAMVEYDLKDRSDQYLHRPGFQCRGGGVVLIRISVDAGGHVIKAELDPSASTTTEDCLIEKALGSARTARFSRSSTAVDPQKGWVKYIFLSQ